MNPLPLKFALTRLGLRFHPKVAERMASLESVLDSKALSIKVPEGRHPLFDPLPPHTLQRTSIFVEAVRALPERHGLDELHLSMLIYGIAYVMEPEDDKPDYLPDGFRDDDFVLSRLDRGLGSRLDGLRLLAARQRILGIWGTKRGGIPATMDLTGFNRPHGSCSSPKGYSVPIRS